MRSAEQVFKFNIAADCTEAFRQLGDAAIQAGKALEHFAAQDSRWAYLPGQWPDKFVLLNRYIRTGVRPKFLFNR